MSAAVVTARHALDAIHIQQQHGQHCIGLLHWTPAPFTACMFTICLHPPSPVRLARLLRSITVYTHAIAEPTVLALSPLTWNQAYLKNRGPWPQPRYNRIGVILKRVITRMQCTWTWHLFYTIICTLPNITVVIFYCCYQLYAVDEWCLMHCFW